jgi:flagellar L-ring protein precursor FlgH
MKNTLLTLLSLASLVGVARSQEGHLLLQPQAPLAPGELTLENSSFTYFEPQPPEIPRELELQSIITVLVDYRTRILSEGDIEHRKTANLNARLIDWITFKNGNLKPSPQSDGDPAVNGALRSQFRAESDMEARDSITFRMAVRIVDIRPNGNLVLEGHQDIENNEERWQLSLTGEVPREAIEPDRTVRSDSIASLRIVKREMGHVRDGYNRGWFQRAYDKFKPF